MVDVSVVISVYSIDRADDVVACIESLKKQTLVPREIIVVLDPDDTLVSYYEKRLDCNVKLVRSNTFGLSAARNEGIKISNSDFVAFIDDDAFADKNWLSNLISNFNDPSVIGVGGKIIPVWPGQNPSWFPEELYWIVGCSYKGLPRKKEPIRNPIGCNMIFRRIVFEKAGFFSTITGRVGTKLMGHDDTEFGIRVISTLLGSKIIYDPEALVYHRVSKNRVNINYILKRSYSEGFSKALMTNNKLIKKVALGIEKKYLHTLFFSAPKMLLKENLKTIFYRYGVLWVSTVMVFIGYTIANLSHICDFRKQK